MDEDSAEIPSLTNSANSVLGGKIMLYSVVTLMAIVLFILCFFFYARLLSRHILHRSSVSTGIPLHHVNLPVYQRGLVPSLIKFVPTFCYSALAHPKGLDCTICLSDFQEGETGRVLPDCRHCFHVECIDMWFMAHSSCPVCRAPVRPTTEDIVVGSGSGSGLVECECSATSIIMVPIECPMKSSIEVGSELSCLCGLCQ